MRRSAGVRWYGTPASDPSAGDSLANKLNRMVILSSVPLVILGAMTCAFALSVAPGRTEIRLAPGQNIKASLTVANDAKEIVQVEVSSKDWFVLEENKSFTVNSWLEIGGAHQFSLKPGERREVALRVTCPKNAQGELVGMVSFLYHASEPSMVTPVISVSIYTVVAGTEKISGEISELGIRSSQSAIQVAIGVKATGNVHLRPAGQVLIFNEKKELVSTIPIREGDPAYPGRERGYFGQDSSTKLVPGRYTLAANLVYRDVKLSKTTDFVVAKDGRIEADKPLIGPAKS